MQGCFSDASYIPPYLDQMCPGLICECERALIALPAELPRQACCQRVIPALLERFLKCCLPPPVATEVLLRVRCRTQRPS